MITPTPGSIYIVKHSSGLIRARFLHTRESGRYLDPQDPRMRTHYIFRNENTGREITLKSRVKILRPTGKLVRYHVGLLQQGSTAVYQYRTDKDCLSPELLHYYGEREVSRESVLYRAETERDSILRMLNDEYGNRFADLRIDFEDMHVDFEQ